MALGKKFNWSVYELNGCVFHSFLHIYDCLSIAFIIIIIIIASSIRMVLYRGQNIGTSPCSKALTEKQGRECGTGMGRRMMSTDSSYSGQVQT